MQNMRCGSGWPSALVAALCLLLGGGASRSVMGADSEARLVLTVSASPTEVNPGGTFECRFEIRNNGPADATDLIFTDVIAAETQFLSIEPASLNLERQGRELKLHLPFLAAGSSTTLAIQLQANIPSLAVNFASVFAAQKDSVLFDNTWTSEELIRSVANDPPQAALSSPSPQAVFSVGVSVTLEAAAADPDGSVTKVEFFANGVKIGEALAEPFSLTWTPPAAGDYALTAKATDNLGSSATSSPVSISVVAQSGPVLVLPPSQTGSEFSFSITAEPGASYLIEAATDFTDWTGLTVLVAVGAQLDFSDFDSPFYSNRFYRATQMP